MGKGDNRGISKGEKRVIGKREKRGIRKREKEVIGKGEERGTKREIQTKNKLEELFVSAERC